MAAFEDMRVSIIDHPTTWVYHYAKIPDSIAIPMPGHGLFDEIWDEKPPCRSTIKMMGKNILTPRFQQTYGRDYFFAGVNNICKPLTPFPGDYLNRLIVWANHHMKENKLYPNDDCKDLILNGIVVNWYDQGHYIGKHSDNEKQLVPNMPIYSFSYGFSRDFDLVPIGKPKCFKTRVHLIHNSLLIMGGTCQSTHTHELPIRKYSGRRVNITIRCFK